MLTFWKKDLKILWRDRTELITILLMPFVLIVILGFALKGLMGGDGSAFEMKVALVEEDKTEQGITEFSQELQQSSLPNEAKQPLMEAAQSFSPKTILLEVLENDLSEQIVLEKMSEADAKQQLADQEVDSILIIPDNFTYHTLQNVFLGEEVTATLRVIKGEHANLIGTIFQNIVEQFSQKLNFETALASVDGVNKAALEPVVLEDIRKEETVTDRDPISSMEYYTIGMAVMFAFYIASAMASKAYTETDQQVVDRIHLSGKHPFHYLAGKVLSVVVLTVIQIGLLFGLSSLILQSFLPFSWEIVLRIGLITVLYALAIGAIGGILTAITVRSGSSVIASMFATGITSVLALLGGSFIPTTTLPPIIQTIGSWTPNGMVMQAYMLANQGLALDDIFPYLLRLTILTFVIFLCSIFIFPKRRTVT
ncbi:ABC transporter permease [Gracilibacillus dipsosauri]|uniref:ABC transporter permease n=1 Tax=Gracilibacillus dipsosauri TaxID=178340 RepID=A0A317L1M0_9BACI|nr:ABC transporter permease [Gracilibacillus dipsosauri]PWU69712.1 ABC transporter permease [Gracilibacillus dipsosauri]